MLAGLALVATILELTLLLGGLRILVWERRVQAGESYFVEGYGDVGSQAQATILCTYFTGRSVISKVFWYSANDIMGVAECPFLDRAG